MLYKETNHNSFTQCGSVFAGTIAGLSCHNDGKVDYRTTWVVETNYYMDLGFLPPNLQYFSISGRAAWIGPKGDANGLPNNPAGASPTKVEFNSEPIRLTFDAGRALLGNKNAHAVDVWVAYRYWQNKFGLDHNAAPGVCTLNGQSTRSCTENTVSSGITVKF